MRAPLPRPRMLKVSPTADNRRGGYSGLVWRPPVGRWNTCRADLELGITGVVRGKTRRTTISDPAAARPPALVDRNWRVSCPDTTWVSDLTYVATWSGRGYVAFVIDIYSRKMWGGGLLPQWRPA